MTVFVFADSELEGEEIEYDEFYDLSMNEMSELEYLMTVNNRLSENLQNALSVVIVVICFMIAFFVGVVLIRGWLNA